MLSRLTRSFAVWLIFVCSASALAADDIPAPPQIGARAWILMDANTGRVLAGHNADEGLEPASVTKIMTAYVAFRELKAGRMKLTDVVSVSENAWRTEGSRTFVDVNARVTVEDLLKGLIVQSGNDASVALAEHIAGSEDSFAGMMNNENKRLGMTHTHWVNATGLPDPAHKTTARDLALVSQAMIRDFPEEYSWFSIKEFTFNGIKQHNRNMLLWRDSSVDGIKTGHTDSAGYCLVSSAKRDGMRLITAILGSASPKIRATETESLLNWGFRFWETRRMQGASEALTSARVWQGAEENVALGIEQDLYVTVPRRRTGEVRVETSIISRITAPVGKGQPLGELSVMLDQDKLANAPLVALSDVAEGSLWQRAVDTVKAWLE